MPASYGSEGQTIDYAHSSAVTAGDVLVVNDLILVAVRDKGANENGTYYVKGRMRFPKTAGGSTALALGTIVYWNAGGGVVSTSSSGNKLLGKVSKAAVDADTDVEVLKTV